MILLSEEQVGFWRENGFLILRQAISPAEIADMLDLVDRQWSARDGNEHHVDILSGEHDGKTYPMREAWPGLRDNVYKLNNLFLNVPALRRIAYSPVIRAALIDLLEGEPLICNSLNFERGSQQPFHFDTWYMPPPVETRMVAANIALEPVDEDNGPITYYPGSHRIRPWRFSDGKLNFKDDEAPGMYAYLEAEIARLGLTTETFSGGAGDAFLWHANLYHGGLPIRDMRRTRKSLVVHYWRAADLPADQVRRDGMGAYPARTLRGEIAMRG
jgi:ectoine hydroxylase-related dioxygenase (phytanoyl-CoA dioxygenase family)